MRLEEAPATVMAVSAAIRRSVNHLATTVKAAPYVTAAMAAPSTTKVA